MVAALVIDSGDSGDELERAAVVKQSTPYQQRRGSQVEFHRPLALHLLGLLRLACPSQME